MLYARDCACGVMLCPLCFTVQSLLNDEQLIQVEEVANKTEEALNKGQFEQATQLWNEAEGLIEKVGEREGRGEGRKGGGRMEEERG